MNVGSIASAVAWNVPAAGGSVDPATAHAQVNAQAATLTALMGSKHGGAVAANLDDGQGVDLYM